jgi:hypothetical protein
MKTYLALVPTVLLTCSVIAAPPLPEQLQLRATFNLGEDLGTPNSMFNPVYANGQVFVSQINNSAQGIGIYTSGSETPVLVLNNLGVIEHRMVQPFRGALSSTYLIASGGATPGTTTTFSRYNFDGSGRVDAQAPGGVTAEGFDWVDDTTIIYTSYASGTRTRLYLAQVTPEPFALTADTRWNANGYFNTGAGVRIRNVRMGDLYSGYAYYGDAGQNTNPKFFALDVATGTETLLGNAGTLTGTGSYGIWTVIERGGYLYVQTTDNGIQVYTMTSATQIGELYATYTKTQITDAAGQVSAQFFGLDVTPDGSRFVLGAATGRVFEFGAPQMRLVPGAGFATVSWPSTVTAIAVQEASTLGSFTDMNPQPSFYVSGKENVADILLNTEAGATFFRLRKTP